MSVGIINTVFLAGCFLVLFVLAELFYHFANVKVEFTRKLVHAGTGGLTLLFPLFLADHWLVLLLCASFAVLLLLSLRFKLLPSVNAIERQSYGSLLYPLSVYLCYLVYEMKGYECYYFYLPILVLAISDPMAALCGRKWPLGKYKAGKGHKTVLGSVVFFISAAIIGFSSLMWGDTHFPGAAFAAFAIAGVTMLAEAFSSKGFDNLTIPLSALVVLMLIGFYN